MPPVCTLYFCAGDFCENPAVYAIMRFDAVVASCDYVVYVAYFLYVMGRMNAVHYLIVESFLLVWCCKCGFVCMRVLVWDPLIFYIVKRQYIAVSITKIQYFFLVQLDIETLREC